MGFVQGYENDIFISYSHIDNEPLIEGKKGWVDFFEDLLRKRLRVKLGGEVKIFRDPQLRHYGKFSDQLVSKLSGSAVLLCVLSPRYVGSDWCLRELEEFCKQAGTDRIIKIVKTALDDQNYRPESKSLFAQIKRILDYRFYRKDESSGLIVDLQPEVIPDHIPICLEMIDAIAQNLVELLINLRESQSKPSAPNSSAPGTAEGQMYVASDPSPINVYLAETTRDLIEERNRVKTELQQFNCRVLPDQPLPQDSEELARAVRNYLEQTKLSIHLIGANYGTRPEMEERSIPHIQYQTAEKMSRAGQLTQVVWMNDGITPKEASQQKFIDYVKNNSPEFLRSRLEDLKTEILKKLRLAQSNGWYDDAEGEPVNVCLFCHEQDMKSIAPLYSHMTVNQMYKVKLPLKDFGPSQSPRQLLQSSDGVLLYYGTADEDWFVNIWRLIQRHVSTGRTKPMPAMGIYVGNPPTAEKDLLESNDLVIIKNYEQFTQSSLTQFVERIRAAKGEMP